MKQESEAAAALNVLIVDDHKLIRDGLRVMLESLKKHCLFNITEAESGEEAMKKIRQKQFDLMLIDYRLPGMSGPEVVEHMRLFRPDLKILALSNFDEYCCIENMIRAGVQGYVLKDIEPSQLLIAIRTVMSNKSYYSNEVALRLIDSGKEMKQAPPSIKETSGLTGRELEVLKLISMELTNDEIAHELCVAKRTIDTHRQNLINKLQAKNTVGLVKAAFALKLID
jgi:DNA-binding NarL/FixJ family response regulator